MVGLNGALSIATGALAAQTAGLEVANNNIANANTPGYSRQMVSLSSAALVNNGVSVDEGVSYGGYTSVRDSVLVAAINAATSHQASLTAQNDSLTQVNTAFSGTTTGIGSAVSTLFSDLSALSTNPSNSAARQTVLTDAGHVANAFHQGATALSDASAAANRQVASTVAQINSLSQHIASLNGQLAAIAAAGEDGGALQDQREQLTSQLAALVGVATTQTEAGPTLTTTNGSPLAIGSTAYALQVTTASDGAAHVLDAQGNDITAALAGGRLGGAIAVRDSTLPQLSGQLDALASQFATAMNKAQGAGYDANGNQGAPMFSLPATGSSAAGIAVALASGAGLALSSGGASNSSANVQTFLAVQASPLPGGQTPSDSYASFVSSVGFAGSEVSSQLTAATTSLQQLTTLQGSESGVSIDEETASLIRYQQAYTAAARVISTVNDLYTVLMNLSMGAN